MQCINHGLNFRILSNVARKPLFRIFVLLQGQLSRVSLRLWATVPTGVGNWLRPCTVSHASASAARRHSRLYGMLLLLCVLLPTVWSSIVDTRLKYWAWNLIGIVDKVVLFLVWFCVPCWWVFALIWKRNLKIKSDENDRLILLTELV